MGGAEVSYYPLENIYFINIAYNNVIVIIIMVKILFSGAVTNTHIQASQLFFCKI